MGAHFGDEPDALGFCVSIVAAVNINQVVGLGHIVTGIEVWGMKGFAIPTLPSGRQKVALLPAMKLPHASLRSGRAATQVPLTSAIVVFSISRRI